MKKGNLWKSPSFYDNILWLCWGILYALAFPTYNLSFTIWFVFAPVFAFAYMRPVYLTVRYSFFYSIPFLFLAFYWLYGFWVPAPFLVVPLYALYYGFFFFCIAYIGKKLKALRWLITPMLWISCELLHSVGFHGFLWNMIGDSQWKNTLVIQSADIFGVWGVSFLVLLINSVLAELIVKAAEKGSLWRAFGRNNIAKLITVLVILLLDVSYGFIKYKKYNNISENSPKERLALLQPNIGSH